MEWILTGIFLISTLWPTVVAAKRTLSTHWLATRCNRKPELPSFGFSAIHSCFPPICTQGPLWQIIQWILLAMVAPIHTLLHRTTKHSSKTMANGYSPYFTQNLAGTWPEYTLRSTS